MAHPIKHVEGVCAVMAAMALSCQTPMALADPPLVTGNRVLWLRSDVGVTAAANGAISSWNDPSSGLTLASGSSAPVLVDEAVSCALSAVRFSGDRMTVTLPSMLS